MCVPLQSRSQQLGVENPPLRTPTNAPAPVRSPPQQAPSTGFGANIGPPERRRSTSPARNPRSRRDRTLRTNRWRAGLAYLDGSAAEYAAIRHQMRASLSSPTASKRQRASSNRLADSVRGPLSGVVPNHHRLFRSSPSQRAGLDGTTLHLPAEPGPPRARPSAIRHLADMTPDTLSSATGC
jgi:hypothetical protein